MEWLESLSDDELKGNDGLKKFESVENLAKSYLELESRAGNSIRIVGPDASDEDRAAAYEKVMKHMPQLVLKPDPDNAEQSKEFYAMLGVPEAPDGYTWEGDGLDETTVTELRSLAAETKMTKTQFKRYVDLMAGMSAETAQRREDARVAMGAELKTEWGMAFEDRYTVVEKFLEENTGLGGIEHKSPQEIKAYYEIARSLIGKPQVHNQPQPPVGRLTPEEAKEQIKEIERNPAYMSTNPADRAEHMRLITKRTELLKQTNPARYG